MRCEVLSLCLGVPATLVEGCRAIEVVPKTIGPPLGFLEIKLKARRKEEWGSIAGIKGTRFGLSGPRRIILEWLSAIFAAHQLPIDAPGIAAWPARPFAGKAQHEWAA